MKNISVLSRVCEAVEWIYLENRMLMRNICIGELITSILAIATSSLILLAILLNKTLHFNVRILLISFCGAFLVANIGKLASFVDEDLEVNFEFHENSFAIRYRGFFAFLLTK